MGLSEAVEAAVSEAVKVTQGLVEQILDGSWPAKEQKRVP
jgi:hypothetical protein